MLNTHPSQHRERLLCDRASQSRIGSILRVVDDVGARIAGAVVVVFDGRWCCDVCCRAAAGGWRCLRAVARGVFDHPQPMLATAG